MTSSFGSITKYVDTGKDHPFVVYLALNKVNGHFYVGATEKGTRGREYVHRWDALESERSYIALLRPYYNKTLGGGGVKGHRHSDESKAKISAAKKGKPGRKMTFEMKDHLSRKKTGISIRFSDAGRDAIILNAKKANEARRRPVICVNDGIEYPSITSASKFYGLTTGQIAYQCSGEHKSRHGLKFRYIVEVSS